MQNGRRTINSRQPKSATPLVVRRRGESNGTSDKPNGSQNAQRSYERYLALAEAQVRAGDIVGAENYYQHAEHYFRTMSSNPEAT
jgi:Domain of unknown function (DUF4167)